MAAIVSISGLSKVYAPSARPALSDINLEINRGEIFALLGPNGAGKTTLISIVCGLCNASSGKLRVDGFDIKENYRETRSLIGLVPQEMAIDAFETVWDSVSFTRQLFGKVQDDAYIEKILKDLALWEKRNSPLRTLSGGMKRRVLIAKALSHEPKILFLDEPTAGVDVELRRSMWQLVHNLRQNGVTIILTTHYIEEAEELADRIGVINHGRIIIVDSKEQLMKRFGRRQLILTLAEALEEVPSVLIKPAITLSKDHKQLTYTYDEHSQENEVASFLQLIGNLDLKIFDLQTKKSSLEEIFIDLLKRP